MNVPTPPQNARDSSMLRFKKIYEEMDKELTYIRINLRQNDLDVLLLDTFGDGTSFIVLPVNPPLKELRAAYLIEGSYFGHTLQVMDEFIRDQLDTIWLELKEVSDEDSKSQFYGKHKFLESWTAQETMEEIRQILMGEKYGSRQIQEGYLQLLSNDNSEEKWVQKDELDREIGNYCSDDFILTFKVNRFHIDDLFN